MPRRKSPSIPLELHRIKSYEFYRKRISAGKEGSDIDDWHEAGEYLAQHPRAILAWNLKWMLVKPFQCVRVGVKTLCLSFKSLLGAAWKWLTFPFWLFWQLPVLFTHADSRPFALDVVKTVISGLGLIATLLAGIGLFLNYWNAQERLITERFSKAVEQIGNEKEEVVIGGIYSLERIAKDSPKDQWTIMEVLTAFVRKNSRIPPEIQKFSRVSRNERLKALENLDPVSIKVQSALTTIGRRNPEKDYIKEDLEREIRQIKILDLNQTNLKQANLMKANLSGANLKEASLFRADLSSANLSRASLWGADFWQASFYKANLSSADLSYADSWGTSFYEANLSSADLFQADLSSADFRKANLSNAHLSSADLSSADLSSADLWQASINGANLIGANLIGARNFNPQQIKSACNWEGAAYTEAKMDESLWVAKDKQANQRKIEELKQDKASDPKEPIDCSRWK